MIYECLRRSSSPLASIASQRCQTGNTGNTSLTELVPRSFAERTGIRCTRWPLDKIELMGGRQQSELCWHCFSWGLVSMLMRFLGTLEFVIVRKVWQPIRPGTDQLGPHGHALLACHRVAMHHCLSNSSVMVLITPFRGPHSYWPFCIAADGCCLGRTAHNLISQWSLTLKKTFASSEATAGLWEDGWTLEYHRVEICVGSEPHDRPSHFHTLINESHANLHIHHDNCSCCMHHYFFIFHHPHFCSGIVIVKAKESYWFNL